MLSVAAAALFVLFKSQPDLMAPIFTPNTRVRRSDGLPATVIQYANEAYEIAYDEGGTGWWPENSLDWLVTPRWVEFSTLLMADQAVNIMLGALLQNAPGLYGGLIVGLQRASDGDYRVFLNAWSAARSMQFIAPELATWVAGLAAGRDLPEEFVAALTE